MADYVGTISLSHARDLSHTSEEEEEEHSPRSVPPLTGIPSGGSSRPMLSANNRGVGGEIIVSTAEVSTRKPRGRPPGSKNKPKPPIVVTRESDSAMKPKILEISAGSDIVETVAQFARRRHLGISILSGTGTVSNVTLRHPVSHTPNLTLHGPFNILSLTGTFLSSSSSYSSSSSSCSFGISLAGAQGQVFGGIVAGKVVAASQVVLVGATFMSSSFHRLPGELGDADEEAKPGGGGGGANAGCSRIPCQGLAPREGPIFASPKQAQSKPECLR
ncbi:hypothetical protein F0562_022628 [Nyssa sinensis]|uniref:PPC domain-containing protein n=1 Tax=Nyssa sinensis TaxID=561372 RepID=A0A5J5BTM1_9ASTE|nr:hypothetical protein F0562_022628 [Nyssa sinensis]